MDKKIILKITIIALLLLFAGFSIFKLTNVSMICWDGLDEMSQPIGGCERQYGQDIQELILPFVILMILLVPLLIAHSKIKK